MTEVRQRVVVTDASVLINFAWIERRSPKPCPTPQSCAASCGSSNGTSRSRVRSSPSAATEGRGVDRGLPALGAGLFGLNQRGWKRRSFASNHGMHSGS